MIPRRRPARAFVLLEVMVAIVIVGVAMVALLRGFVAGLDAQRKIRRNEVAVVLSRSLLDDMILEPPGDGRYEGEFADDPRFGEAFADWSWEMDVEEVEPRYEERPKGQLIQDLEPELRAEVKILYRDGSATKTMMEFQTILLQPELFSSEALQMNQLF